MDNKKADKEIRRISNLSTLPILVYYVLYILMLCFVLPLFYNWLLRKTGVNLTENMNSFIQHIIIYFMIIPACILGFKLSCGKNIAIRFKDCFKKPQKSSLWIFQWIIISIGISLLAATFSDILFSMLQNITGITLYGSGQASTASAGDYIMNTAFKFLPACVFAPIIEELFFRGMIFKSQEKLGELFALVSSSLLFGLWHMDYSHLIYTPIVGGFACFLYIKTRSLYPSIIFHFSVNFITVLREHIGSMINVYTLKTGNAERFTEVIIPTILLFIITLIVIVICIAGVILFIKKFKKHKKNECFRKNQFNVSTLRTIKLYLTSPMVLITLTVSLICVTLNTIYGFYAWI